ITGGMLAFGAKSAICHVCQSFQPSVGELVFIVRVHSPPFRSTAKTCTCSSSVQPASRSAIVGGWPVSLNGTMADQTESGMEKSCDSVYTMPVVLTRKTCWVPSALLIAEMRL